MKEKRKWITQKQLSEVRREMDQLRALRKRENLPENNLTFMSYGSPKGQYVAAFALDQHRNRDHSKTLKTHKNKNKKELPEYPYAHVFNS